jgi:hypothetical protein
VRAVSFVEVESERIRVKNMLVGTLDCAGGMLGSFVLWFENIGLGGGRIHTSRSMNPK